MPVPYSLALADLLPRLRERSLLPSALARDVLDAASDADTRHAWIARTPADAVLARARQLESNPAARALPLYGVPFAVKDNIDATGFPTTAGCPAYAYRPERSATVVDRLLNAGAILIGKTNLDQFATGLVGTRSPYGACGNAFDPAYISGGSSSGSAITVAMNLVSFSLGTDTAGSGRVPAGFNNIVGLKPTRGSISTTGVVPACRSLDCVSIFALTVGDAWDVWQAARGHDATDPYSRCEKPGLHWNGSPIRCGVLRADQLDFHGDAAARRCYELGLSQLERLGATFSEVDYEPLRDTAALLYQGPWVAERLAAIKEFFAAHADALHPTTREITAAGQRYSAVDAFEGAYRLQTLRQRAAAELAQIDVLAVPTSPTIYTIDEVNGNPLELNARLGTYTNFVNLLDLAAIAVPAGMRGDGLPAGVTLIGPAFSEPLLCALGERVHAGAGVKMGATGFPLPAPRAAGYRDNAGDARVTIAVVGAHLSGMPLNHQLTSRGGTLVHAAKTAPSYRLFELAGTVPAKPGLVRCKSGTGHAIEVELWTLPVAAYGSFVALIPAPLAIGTLELADGASVQGFICESHALEAARDISEFGGWRAFVLSQAAPPR